MANGRDALVWVTDRGDAHTFGQGSTGKQFSRPVGHLALKKPTFVPSTGTDHDALIFSTTDENTLAVMDTDMGQWLTWTTHAPVMDIYATRDGVSALFAVAPFVGSYTGKGLSFDAATPAVTPISTLKTRLLPLGHLGRVKSIKPLGKATDADTEMTIRVYSDRSQQIMAGNTQVFDIGPSAVRWPREELPEMRLAVQRMESFAVEVIFVPGTVRLRSLQVEIKRERGNPRNQRK